MKKSRFFRSLELTFEKWTFFACPKLKIDSEPWKFFAIFPIFCDSLDYYTRILKLWSWYSVKIHNRYDRTILLKIHVKPQYSSWYFSTVMVTHWHRSEIRDNHAHFDENTSRNQCAFWLIKPLLKAPDHKSHIHPTEIAPFMIRQCVTEHGNFKKCAFCC